MSLSIAFNRFGLGARPDELVHSDSQAWLVSQLLSYDPLPAAWKQQPRTAALVGTWNDMQRSVRLAPEGQRSGIREKYLRDGSLVYQAAVGARTASALESSTRFISSCTSMYRCVTAIERCPARLASTRTPMPLLAKVVMKLRRMV